MPSRSDRLSPRQLDLCQAIERFRVERGFGPSLRDLSESLGISASGVKSLVGACIRKRAVASDAGIARSLRVVRRDDVIN